MTHKNNCPYKGQCHWAKRRCGFLTDRGECNIFQQFAHEERVLKDHKPHKWLVFFLSEIFGMKYCPYCGHHLFGGLGVLAGRWDEEI